MKSLKHHPFPVEAFFERSIVLTFAVPREEVEHLIPECLTLDLFQDRWAFIAVAVVQTKDLRIKGFPKVLGNDFILIGYRIFVRYTTQAGKRLRGLCILKSQTDKKRMEIVGNLFTRYHYTTTDVALTTTANETTIASDEGNFFVRIDRTEGPVALPDASPFADWKEARRFAGPLPFTFSYDSDTRSVVIIEGVRQHWEPAPVHVSDYRIPFIDSLNLKGAVLANAFMITDVPYYWKRGRTELWHKSEDLSRASAI
jgi:hypothetical protein